MRVRRRLYAAFGFGYLGCVSVLAGLLVAFGCLLDRIGGSSTGYDAAVVGLVARLVRPVDLIPLAEGPPRRAAESAAPTDEPA